MNGEIASCISKLYKKHGVITPDIVIEAAKDPKSPLHGEFEWDVEKAAITAWRETARRIIRSVRINITTISETIAAPRYVRTPFSQSGEQSYSDIARIKTDREQAAEVLRYEMERLESVMGRVKKIAAALDLTEEVAAIEDNIASIKGKVLYAAVVDAVRPTATM